MTIKVTGLDKVLLGLNTAINRIEGGTIQGLLEAAVLVKNESVKLTPIDTGNLRASAYILWGGGKVRTKGRSAPTFKSVARGKRGSAERFGNIARLSSEHNTIINERKGVLRRHPFSEIGYTAFYAAMVHENLVRSGRKGSATRFKNIAGGVAVQHKTGQAKFLETALKNNSRNIFAIIKRRARII